MSSDAPTPSVVKRVAWRTRFEIRTSWGAMAGPGIAAFLLSLLLPVQNAWVAAAAAGGFAAVFLLCILIGALRKQDVSWPADLNGPPRDVVLEHSSTIEQFGHAFGRVALILAGFTLGIYAAQAFA